MRATVAASLYLYSEALPLAVSSTRGNVLPSGLAIWPFYSSCGYSVHFQNHHYCTSWNNKLHYWTVSRSAAFNFSWISHHSASVNDSGLYSKRRGGKCPHFHFPHHAAFYLPLLAPTHKHTHLSFFKKKLKSPSVCNWNPYEILVQPKGVNQEREGLWVKD